MQATKRYKIITLSYGKYMIYSYILHYKMGYVHKMYA